MFLGPPTKKTMLVIIYMFTKYVTEKTFTTAQRIIVEFNFVDNVAVPAGVTWYASMLTNKLISFSSERQWFLI